MSSCIPLTTKKNGTKTPKATPVSLESNPGTSRSLSSWRVIMPAAKPPSSRSSPSSNASSASANTSTTIQRTASCELFSIVCSNSRSAGDLERTASSATATASPTKPSRISALWIALWVDRISVSSRIGPNSPTAPAASRYVPSRVRSSPLSDSTGISVPIAVVASAEPV